MPGEREKKVSKTSLCEEKNCAPKSTMTWLNFVSVTLSFYLRVVWRSWWSQGRNPQHPGKRTDLASPPWSSPRGPLTSHHPGTSCLKRKMVVFRQISFFAQVLGGQRVEATVVNDRDTNIVFIPLSLGPHCQKWFWSKKFTENTFSIQIMTFCIVSDLNVIIAFSFLSLNSPNSKFQ